MLLFAALAGAAFAAEATTTLVSVASDGTPANQQSDSQSLSSDGRYVAFESHASNLVAGDTNGALDVFVRDTVSGATTRVSVDSSGAQGSNVSQRPSISAAGRYVAFNSYAPNLVSGDTNGTGDVFVHDTVTGNTTRVSIGSNGAQGNGSSDGVAISGDGRYVAFESFASNLVPSDTNGTGDVFVHDTVTGNTTRVSIGSNGAQGNGQSRIASISSDGRYVAFESSASNLVPNDTGHIDVFVHDTVTTTTTRVSVDSNGVQGNHASDRPSISADGRYVAFQSSASNLVAGDTNGTRDIFVHDMATGTTDLASVDSSGAQGEHQSDWPAISGDGRYVAFLTHSTLVADDTNGQSDVFVHDTASGSTVLASVAHDGTQSNGPIYEGPSISADGGSVAWTSPATNLVPGDTNGWHDVFLRKIQFPPVLGQATAQPTPAEVGTPVSVSAPIVSSAFEVAAAEWWVGDNSPSPGTATPAALNNGTVSTTADQLAVGVHRVNLRAVNSVGHWSSVQSVYVVVYDPNGGFATGGGWITPGGDSSDPGDALPGLDGSSKANFGFVAKYNNGADTVPAGNFEFHYRVGEFKLRSAQYDWLVVTNKEWAHFQGLGRIDGMNGLWPFRVSARDGTQDRLILKVYPPGSNPDVADPVYKASGDVENGQIRIHRQ